MGMDMVSKLAKKPDIRFQSDAGTTASTQVFEFPLDLAVRKPSHEAALATARQVLATIEKDAMALGVGAILFMAYNTRFEYETKGTILLELTGRLTLTPPTEASFWHRTEGIARVLDVIQRHCEPSKERADVGVYTGRAELSATTNGVAPVVS